MRLLACVLVFSGCAADESYPIELRMCNETGHDFDSLTYNGMTELGPVADGACSDYQPTAEAYRSASVDFDIGPDRFAFTPIDHVGETPLAAGRWSYRILIHDYEERACSAFVIEN